MANVVVLTVALAALLPLAVSASEAPLPSHHCAAIAKANARLACFDASFVAPDGSLHDSHASAVDTFGLRGADLHARDPNRPVDVGLDRIELVVERIDDRAGGKAVMTMQNGQVWTADRHSVAGRLSVGDSVVIRDAAMSSHMLVTPTGVTFRVRRAR